MAKYLNVFLLCLTIISCGQPKQNVDKDKERIDNVCDKFMQIFAEGKFSDALLLLKQNTAMTAASIDTLQVTIDDQVKNLFPAYGKILSSEFIIEHKVKDFISKRFYILKFDKYYLKFDFTLYNNGKNWTIISFAYDEGLIELLY